MNKQFLFASITSFLLISMSSKADIPSLDVKQWLGYFIGIEEKKFHFGVTTTGEGVLMTMKRDGTPVVKNAAIKVRFEILETMPDGKVISRKIKKETLTSTQNAAIDPKEPITFRGQVTGGAAFEATVMPESKGFSLSGKITGKGKIRNPVSFAITTAFSEPYKYRDKDDDVFEDKIKRDKIELKLTSGKQVRLKFKDPINPAALYPEGFTAAEIEMEAYRDTRFLFTATEKSKLVFEDKGGNALWNGFALKWSVNEGADASAEKVTFIIK
ncbi:MAG: hypothetical protein H7Y36_08720 [Armatimonadetes bacterium]|nr:hypothetical protein [Akkermansiaceae bacterium]